MTETTGQRPTWAELSPDPGDRVRFVADLTRSGENELFGFYKRPREASVVEHAETETAGEGE